MPCFYCTNLGYWVCDPNARDPTQVCDQDIVDWHRKGTVTLSAGLNNVWCRPGSPDPHGPCDAKIQDDPPGATPPWHLAGQVGKGKYDMYCRPGGVHGPETCQVRLDERPS